jgi:hypothetical protein
MTPAERDHVARVNRILAQEAPHRRPPHHRADAVARWACGGAFVALAALIALGVV